MTDKLLTEKDFTEYCDTIGRRGLSCHKESVQSAKRLLKSKRFCMLCDSDYYSEYKHCPMIDTGEHQWVVDGSEIDACFQIPDNSENCGATNKVSKDDGDDKNG